MAAGDKNDVTGFISNLIKAFNGRVTPATIRALTTWQRMEGGSTNNVDSWNFLNTKQPEPGSHGTLGSQGNAIQAYQNFQQGLHATIQTLQNGRYPAIVHAIVTGNWTPTPELAKDLKTWSGGGYTSILGSAAGTGPVNVGAYTQPVRTLQSASAPAVPGAPPHAVAQSNSAAVQAYLAAQLAIINRAAPPTPTLAPYVPPVQTGAPLAARPPAPPLAALPALGAPLAALGAPVR